MVLFDYRGEFHMKVIESPFEGYMKDSYQTNASFTKHNLRLPFVMSQLKKMMYFLKLKGNNSKHIQQGNLRFRRHIAAPCIPKSFPL